MGNLWRGGNSVFQGVRKRQFEADQTELYLVAPPCPVAVRRNRHSEPENAPTLLLTAENLWLGRRCRPIVTGIGQVGVRQGYIRVRGTRLQGLVYEIHI